MPWIGGYAGPSWKSPGSPIYLRRRWTWKERPIGCRVPRAPAGRSCGSLHVVAQVRGVAALEDAHQLLLDRLGQVVEQVEEPPSRTEQDGDDVDLDLV